MRAYHLVSGLTVLMLAAAVVPGVRAPRIGDQAAAAQAVTGGTREAAYRANNIGVARLEQYDFDAAATSFQEALRLVPDLTLAHLNLAVALFYGGKPDAARSEAETAAATLPSPHAYYLLGLIARTQDRPDDALRDFQKALEMDPADVGTKVNLGQVYTQQRNFPRAVALLREAAATEPYNATAAYGLAMALTRSADPGGPEAMKRFETLRGTPYARTYSQTYLEQGPYAEALASTGAEADLVDPARPAVTFADTTGDILRSARPGAAAGSVVLADLNGDGALDIVESGAGGVRIYRNSTGAFSDVTRAGGFEAAAGGTAGIAVAGDYDNDGHPDLFVSDERGSHLFHQGANGRFEAVTGLPAFAGAARAAAFVDVDHDGDLDLFIVGGLRAGAPGAGAAAATAPNQLLRNNGDGSFTDITAEARVASGDAAGVAVVPTDFDNRRDIDLLVVRRDARPVLFQNVRDGSFRDAAEEAGLPGAGAYTAVAAGDINKDGFTDFFFGRADGPGTFVLSDGRGRFVSKPAPGDTAGAVAAQMLDYDNDGLLDLFVLRAKGAALLRNLGDRWEDLSAGAGLGGAAFTPPGEAAYQSAAAGDVDGDGDTDLVVRLSDGSLRVWRNDGGSSHGSVRVRLEPQQSNRTGAGTKIDIRAGSLRQRFETSAAVPSAAPADILFGLGSRPAADVVRVLWPSGTVQAELPPAATATAQTVTVTELNRKPSSCPYLFTWNGSAFEFVTDFMGGGELGYWLAPGQHAAPDPDEYVRIRPGQLQARDGRYEIRVTNELEEALFVDRLQLVAVDHPAGTDVFPNEGLKEAPLPPFALATTRGARPPAAATDDHGHDVLARVAALDRQSPDDFPLIQPRGYAEFHTLTLDLGADANRAVLLLTGWTDYAFSSDNVAGFQQGLALKPPALEVRDDSGRWQPLIEDIGIPVGRPQTVVVDLRGKLPRGHEVRIRTNMRIYWDQVLVDTSGGGGPTRLTRLDPATASLGWRGFSAEVTPDGREPFLYDYSRVSRESTWKVMPGRYTREGDVRELLRRTDDIYVVAKPGDEIALAFEAAALPPLPAGQTRTFLLYADGYSKEMDINSASPHQTDPMPFHRMTQYPYGPSERYPDTAAYKDYLARYNTRIVHSPLPPLDRATD
ncbi:MAG: FG-GAP-like repeat-containing protein [Acidobacteriota bacterium]